MIKNCTVCKENFNSTSNNQLRCIKCSHKKCEECGNMFKPNGIFSRDRFCSRKCSALNFTGYKHSDENKKKISEETLGKPKPNLVGKNNHFWKGGIYKFHRREKDRIMHTLEYKNFRRNVIKRDGKCTNCGTTDDLQVHHIKSFALFPDLRTNIDNAITLCFACHRKTANYGKS